MTPTPQPEPTLLQFQNFPVPMVGSGNTKKQLLTLYVLASHREFLIINLQFSNNLIARLRPCTRSLWTSCINALRNNTSLETNRNYTSKWTAPPLRTWLFALLAPTCLTFASPREHVDGLLKAIGCSLRLTVTVPTGFNLHPPFQQDDSAWYLCCHKTEWRTIPFDSLGPDGAPCLLDS